MLYGGTWAVVGYRPHVAYDVVFVDATHRQHCGCCSQLAAIPHVGHLLPRGRRSRTGRSTADDTKPQPGVVRCQDEAAVQSAAYICSRASAGGVDRSARWLCEYHLKGAIQSEPSKRVCLRARAPISRGSWRLAPRCE